MSSVYFDTDMTLCVPFQTVNIMDYIFYNIEPALNSVDKALLVHGSILLYIAEYLLIFFLF